MSSNRQSWYPPVDPNMTPEEMALHLRLIYTALNDHDQAIVSVSQKTGTVTNNTTVVQSGGGGGGGGGIPSLGGVNDQIGATTYTTQQSDNGAKILMGDSSPVTVTLNGAVTTPWFTFIGNDSSSTVSLVASHGTLKGQNYIEPGLFGIIFFDGANFWSEGTPIAHDSSLGIVRPDNTSIKVDSTGVLSASALSFSQISGVASPAQLPVATTSALGVVKPDGTSITIASGVISATPPAFGTLLASFSSGSLTANTGPTAISGFTIPSTGRYMICMEEKIVTAASSSSTSPSLRVIYTSAIDGVAANSQLGTGENSTGNTTSVAAGACGVFDIHSGSTIQYETTAYASSPANTMAYKFSIYVYSWV